MIKQRISFLLLWIALCNIAFAEANSSQYTNDTQEKTGFQSRMFPFCFMKNNALTICENLPITLINNSYYLNTNAKKRLQGKRGRLTIYLPTFIKLKGVAKRTPTRISSGDYGYLPLPFKESNIIRDKHPYRRYDISLDKTYAGTIGTGKPNWFGHNIFLLPEKNSAGKKGNIFWTLTLGEERLPEQQGTLEILSPLPKAKVYTKRFKLVLAGIATMDSPFPELAKTMMDYWSQLYKKPIVFKAFTRLNSNIYPAQTRKRLHDDFQHALLFNSNKESIYLSFPKIHEKFTKKLASGLIKPHLISDKGKPITGSLPAWYIIEDPDNVYEKYLREGFAEARKCYPNCKLVAWDFEPGHYDYCREGRERFAQYLKLTTVPSIAEIKSKYASKWFQYKLVQHQKIIAKTIKIFKEIWPEASLYLCSDPLHAGRRRLSKWCAVDVTMSDGVVNGHMHMPYYCGTRFFNDVEYNLKELKKPFLPLNDPAERILSFFRQYTPDKIRQNIIAAAALGCEGFGFWPNDALSGLYFKSIQSAYEQIAEVEEFYFTGKRDDDAFKITVRNTRTQKVKGENGRVVTVTTPDFSTTLKTLIHRKNDKFMITALNYDDKHTAIINVAGQGMNFLVELPPNGAKIINPDKINPVEQKRLTEKVNHFLTTQSGVSQFSEKRQGKTAITWSALNVDGVLSPVLKMSNTAATLLIEGKRGRDIISFSTLQDKNNLKQHINAGGFLGQVILYDPKQTAAPYHFELKDIAINNGVPEAVFHYKVPPFDGANPEMNPLLDLIIEKTITLSQDGKRVDIAVNFHNPTTKAMNFGFRIKNLLTPGKSNYDLSAEVKSNGKPLVIGKGSEKNNLFIKKNQSVNFLKHEKRKLWDGGEITANLGNRNTGKLTFSTNNNIAGVFIWKGDVLTVELLSSEITLNANDKKALNYSVKLP